MVVLYFLQAKNGGFGGFDVVGEVAKTKVPFKHVAGSATVQMVVFVQKILCQHVVSHETEVGVGGRGGRIGFAVVGVLSL